MVPRKSICLFIINVQSGLRLRNAQLTFKRRELAAHHRRLRHFLFTALGCGFSVAAP